MRRLPCWTLLTLLFTLLGCTTDSRDQGVILEPVKPVVHVGEQVVLNACPQEDLAEEPEWEIKEAYGGGFLNSRGLRTTYVAPVSAGRFTLILRSKAADGSHMKSTHPIRVLPIVQIEPSEIRLSPGGSAAFSVHIKGLHKTSVTWSVEESDGGTITADGNYTAPRHSGTFHIVATSTVESDAIAIASVQVE